jgi:hypothetical protein
VWHAHSNRHQYANGHKYTDRHPNPATQRFELRRSGAVCVDLLR